jgi:hypothetical protein
MTAFINLTDRPMKEKCTLIIVLLIVAAPIIAAQDIDSRLKDHYIGKPVVVKLPMPDEKQIMLLYPERDDVFDQALYKLKLERVGVGLYPGMIALISELDVDRDEITFHFVGMGYEGPLGTIPTEILDNKVFGEGSARVKMKLPRNLSEIENPVTTINGWLSTIIGTRTLVTSEDLPEPVRIAIGRKEVTTGMNRKAVYLSLGEPTEVLRELEGTTMIEAWVYDKEDFSSIVVIFENGRVVEKREF